MEFRKNPDGSVEVIEGVARVFWPTMEDCLSSRPLIAGVDMSDKAPMYVASLREEASGDSRDPDSADELETLSRTREGR